MNVLQIQNDLPVQSYEFCWMTTSNSNEGVVVVDRPTKRQCTTGGLHRRLPCRARSLSNHHNSDTAYFEIPLDAPHGLQLHCSHKECIQSGRRFRYCEVCKIPVAKRNFVKRHGHGMVNSARELRETIDRLNPCRVISDVDTEQDMEESTNNTPMRNTSCDLSEGFNDISSSENEEDAEDLESLVLETLSDSRTKNITTTPTISLLGENSIPNSKQNTFKETEDKSSSRSKTQSLNSHNATVVMIPAYDKVPNPLTTIVTQVIPQVIPSSPKMQHSSLEISPDIFELSHFDLKAVPFARPGLQITEAEFAKAVDGIDFARIFD